MSAKRRAGWVWVDISVVLALHDEHLAEHGGLAGIRDRSALESALTRPANKAGYEDADAAALAAAYAYGIGRSHPFADGNKRSSLIVAELFLASTGFPCAHQMPNASPPFSILPPAISRKKTLPAGSAITWNRLNADVTIMN